MAITRNPLELSNFHSLVVFAWIVKEELLSAKVAKAKESPSFRLIHTSNYYSNYDYFFFLFFFLFFIISRVRKKEEEEKRL